MMDDSIIAAIIGVGASAVGGGIGWFASRALRKQSVADKNLAAQLVGWQQFTVQLQERITDLEKRITECERDRANLWRQLNEKRN